MSNRGLTGLLGRVETTAHALARAQRGFDQAVAAALERHSYREVMRAAGFKSPSGVQAAKRRASKVKTA